MKKYIIVTTAFLTLLSSSNFILAAEATAVKNPEATAAAQSQTPQVYQSKEGNYSIQLPGGWELRNGFMGTDVLALSPDQKNPMV